MILWLLCRRSRHATSPPATSAPPRGWKQLRRDVRFLPLGRPTLRLLSTGVWSFCVGPRSRVKCTHGAFLPGGFELAPPPGSSGGRSGYGPDFFLRPPAERTVLATFAANLRLPHAQKAVQRLRR